MIAPPPNNPLTALDSAALLVLLTVKSPKSWASPRVVIVIKLIVFTLPDGVLPCATTALVGLARPFVHLVYKQQSSFQNLSAPVDATTMYSISFTYVLGDGVSPPINVSGCI